MRILALDVGTSSVKAAVLDVAAAAPVGTIMRETYALDFPSPDGAEVPALRLWTAVAGAARAAARETPGVEAIGLSCLMPALVLLDGAGDPLAPIWLHLDRRARPVARKAWAEVGEEFLKTTGNRPLPGGISVTCYRQQVAQDATLPARVKSYLHAHGWLAFHLTGERVFDRGNACFTGLYGTVTNQRWSERWCEYFQVDPAWLPPVVSGDTTIGSLRSAIAEEIGLPAGLPVKIGTADTSSAMLAAGMEPGDLLHVVGTTQVLSAFAARPQPSPRHLTRQLGVGDPFIHVTHNPVGGVALEWLYGLCFRDQSEAEFYERTVPLATLHATSVCLDPPFLGGDRLEIEAHRAAFRELTLASDRLDLLAAVLVAMRRGHQEAVEALGVDPHFRRIFLTGGGASVVQQLVPGYRTATIHPLDEGSLRGVARLFRE